MNESGDGARTGFAERLRAGRDETRALGAEAIAIAADLRRLLQLEGELAKAEANEATGYATRGLGLGAAAAVMLLLFSGFLFLTVMFALDTAMPQWLAALITAGIILLIAAVLGLLARSQLQKFSPLPRRFISGVREDIVWARNQTARIRSLRR